MFASLRDQPLTTSISLSLCNNPARKVLLLTAVNRWNKRGLHSEVQTSQGHAAASGRARIQTRQPDSRDGASPLSASPSAPPLHGLHPLLSGGRADCSLFVSLSFCICEMGDNPISRGDGQEGMRGDGQRYRTACPPSFTEWGVVLHYPGQEGLEPPGRADVRLSIRPLFCLPDRLASF